MNIDKVTTLVGINNDHSDKRFIREIGFTNSTLINTKSIIAKEETITVEVNGKEVEETVSYPEFVIDGEVLTWSETSSMMNLTTIEHYAAIDQIVFINLYVREDAGTYATHRTPSRKELMG